MNGLGCRGRFIYKLLNTGKTYQKRGKRKKGKEGKGGKSTYINTTVT